MFPNSFLLATPLVNSIADAQQGLRPPLCPLRHAVLSAHHMQRRGQDAVRWRQGAGQEHGRGESDY
jgi:hypothetical protein